ncbi:MAG: GxxExxY protein [Gemmatimonadaceae bacterium]
MSNDQLIEEQLTESVIGAFYEVYNTLGFRFLEQVYMMALERELRARDHVVGREVWVPIYYKGEEICRQRIDMIVDERLVVEAKSTHDLHKSAPRQLYNYLRATRIQVGLLLHFGPEPAFYRLVHTHPAVPPAQSKGVIE